MNLDEFISKGWDDHAKDAAGVFGRFPDGIALVSQPKHLPPLAGLIVHVSGEHLGRWDDGLALLGRLEAHPSFDAASPAGKAVIRSKAVLHLAAGRRAEAERLEEHCRAGGPIPPASDRIRILATASSALAGQRRTAEARALFEEALALASYGPTRDDPAARALAVTGNNLACDYELRPSRTPDEAELMVRAAETGLRFWSITGTWIETERAHYRLSCSQRTAGHTAKATTSALQCLEIVELNGGDPGELFYAREALALAHHAARESIAARRLRDAAAATIPSIKDDDFRSMATDSLSTLDTTLGVTPPAPRPNGRA
jgi:hypothetical protein